jgi:hypothetical protein
MLILAGGYKPSSSQSSHGQKNRHETTLKIKDTNTFIHKKLMVAKLEFPSLDNGGKLKLQRYCTLDIN